MKRLSGLLIAIILILSLFTSVSAEADVVVLNEDYGKVKILGKVQSNGSTAFAVRSSFGENEAQDVIQYFVRDTAQSSSSGMEANPSFDFYPKQRLVEKALKDKELTAKAEATLEKVKVTISNESETEGKPYTVVTVFYGKKPLGVKIHNF